MTKKKLQIFISSTFTDLMEERQASVESILGSKHIPAGMELFKAGNASQLETIKKWINESDIYMLILGGRYGSIESESGKSYTQIEYEYALEKNIPVFAVVLSDKFLFKKASEGKYDVFEKDNKEKYEQFKKFVMTKIIKLVDDCKDIQIAIKDSISELEDEYGLCGWVRGSDIDDNTQMLKENNILLKENEKLKEQIKKLNQASTLGNFKYEELKKILKGKKIIVPGKYMEDKADYQINYLDFIKVYKDKFIMGIENRSDMPAFAEYIFFKIGPYLMSLGILELNKVTGVKYRRLEMSKSGLDFVARLEIEELNVKNLKYETNL